MHWDVVGSTLVHLLVAAVWAGSVVFVTWAVLPLARDGRLDADPLSAVAGSLRWVSRVAAVLLLLTGGHLAAVSYSTSELIGSARGHLVLTMVVLWLALTGLVEVAAGRLTDGTERQKVREPAAKARPFLLAASVVALLLLAVGGLLTSGYPG
jgi:putative copper export protein